MPYLKSWGWNRMYLQGCGSGVEQARCESSEALTLTVQKGASLGMNACKSINFGPWRGPWIWDMYSGCM